MTTEKTPDEIRAFIEKHKLPEEWASDPDLLDLLDCPPMDNASREFVKGLEALKVDVPNIAEIAIAVMLLLKALDTVPEPMRVRVANGVSNAILAGLPVRDGVAIDRTVNEEIPGANDLLNELTGWRSVRGIIAEDGKSAYRPTCRTSIDPRMPMVADIFDRTMELIGDPRRAVRDGDPVAGGNGG